MNALWQVRALRWMFVAAHVVVVFAIVVLIANRNDSDPVAATKLDVNHRLVAADLRMAKTEPLLGRYLREPVDAGKPISAAMLSPRPWPSPLVNGIAAIVTLPLTIAKQRQITVGAAVTLTLKKVSAQIQGKVVWKDCDAKNCVYLVGLPISQALPTDPGAYTDADISLVATKGP